LIEPLITIANCCVNLGRNDGMAGRATSVASISERFEKLCQKLLEQEGYEISTSHASFRSEDGSDGLGIFVDFWGRSPNCGKDFVAETKFYLSARSSVLLFHRALAQTKHHIETLSKINKVHENTEGLLIVNISASEEIIKHADELNVDVWDLKEIKKLASKNRDLYVELNLILDHQIIPPHDHSFDRDEIYDASNDWSSGEDLVRKFETIPAGRDGWREFEAACEEAMKYLFAHEMHYWKSQHGIEDGFHRPDLIARIRDAEGIWSLLARDHRTRYVVFEFKNYVDPITQDQIYSTEKYLFPNALRSIAIIIARAGSDPGAKRAARAALRGSGKLILDFGLDELTEMVQRRYGGDDPGNLIAAKVDGLLTDLAP